LFSLAGLAAAASIDEGSVSPSAATAPAPATAPATAATTLSATAAAPAALSPSSASNLVPTPPSPGVTTLPRARAPLPGAWYVTFDQGFGNQPVPSPLRTLMDQRGTGAKDSVLTLNVGAGIYQKQDFGPYLLGAQLELFEDTYDAWQGHQFTITQGYLAFSGIDYLGPDPGQGCLIRADVGEVLAYLDDSQTRNNPFGFSGIRVQCGFGYAMPLDPRRRFGLVGMINGIVETDNQGRNPALGDEMRVGLVF